MVTKQGLKERMAELKRGIRMGRIKKKKILRTLNLVDTALQRILRSGENCLKPKSKEPFFEEILKTKSERKYWRTLLYGREKLSDVGLRKS